MDDVGVCKLRQVYHTPSLILCSCFSLSPSFVLGRLSQSGNLQAPVALPDHMVLITSIQGKGADRFSHNMRLYLWLLYLFTIPQKLASSSSFS